MSGLATKRGWYVLRLRHRDDDESRQRIEAERAWQGPIRDPAYLHGRVCPADWVRSRWMRRGRREASRPLDARRGKRLVGEWRRVSA